MGDQIERVSAGVAKPEARPPALAHYTNDDLELIRRFVAPKSSDHELAFFLEYAQAAGLNPFQGEIVGVPRWNAKDQREVMSIQVTVRGERTLAERTGLYGGQDPPQWCGPEGRWIEVWLSEKPPAAARVAVYRKDWDRPAVGVARWASYVQLNKQGQPVNLWKTAPDLMLAKCAEASALRKAFTGGRDLSPASKVSMEARRAGLDDDGRHALVADVTNGRTSSTRDLTDDELLEVRAELARLGAEPPSGVDSETGEVVDAEPVEEADTPETEHRALVEKLVPRARALTGEARHLFHIWLDGAGIGSAKKVKDYTLADLRKVEEALAEFEKPLGDEEPF
jgi:phage recombination protein Bet